MNNLKKISAGYNKKIMLPILILIGVPILLFILCLAAFTLILISPFLFVFLIVSNKQKNKIENLQFQLEEMENKYYNLKVRFNTLRKAVEVRK